MCLYRFARANSPASDNNSESKHWNGFNYLNNFHSGATGIDARAHFLSFFLWSFNISMWNRRNRFTSDKESAMHIKNSLVDGFGGARKSFFLFIIFKMRGTTKSIELSIVKYLSAWNINREGEEVGKLLKTVCRLVNKQFEHRARGKKRAIIASAREGLARG